MTVKNMAELEKALLKETQKAMRVVSEKTLGDMYEETGEFYTQENPKPKYQRTGALGDTPRVTGLSTSGNEVFFDAYLDQSHNYTTGSFTMPQVLEAAESSKAGISGVPHFWADSEEKIEKDLDNTMSKFFKKS